MKKINKLVCLLLSVMLSLPAMAQQARTLKGVIHDENNEPVAGAIIKSADAATGTLSDMDGKFELPVGADQNSIEVSFLGYRTQTVDITSKTEVSITLVPSDNTLDEVVVVGYGTQRRAHLTGAISTVSPSEISDLATSNLSERLEGMMPGISVTHDSNRPGEASRIKIRPTGSDENETPDPLFVIDDFIAGQGAFNNLDPSEIESISVLKDAAAAVYGSRSANGVVIVKTKRGHAGKPQISYNGQFGLTDEFYRSKMLDSYNYGLIWNAVRVADPTQTGFEARRHLFQADELEAMKGLNYDLLDQYWSSALTQKHTVTVSGGGESLTAFGAITYQTQDGNIGRLKYDRWNFRAGIDAKISQWLKTSLTVSGDYGSNYRSNNRIGGTSDEKDYNTLQVHPRYIPEYVTDPATGLSYPLAPLGISNTTVAGSGSNVTQLYHYDMIENSGDFLSNMPQYMMINGSLDYNFGWNDILKGLNLKLTYAKSINNSKSNEYASQYRLYTFADGTAGRGGSGNHLYMDTPGYPLDFSMIGTRDADNGNRLRRTMSRSDNYQLNFIVSYARTFGLHDVSGLFTIEKSESESEDLWGNVTMPYTFTNLQSNTAQGDQTTAFARSESGNLSYVGRVNYVYADKYLAEFLIRSDASTKFAPENYWGVFPSLSLGWVISEESWFQRSVSFMDFLKVRGSFGLLGRDNITAWAWQQFYNQEVIKGPIFGNNPDLNAGPHFQIPNAVPNRNSHWDKSYKSNIGLDMHFLNNRLTANIDGYYDHYKDVFMAISSASDFPTTVGANASASNYGETANWGAELSLGWNDRIGEDFKYWVKVNTSWTDDKQIKFPGMDDPLRDLDALVKGERSDRGQWGYQAIGMFTNYQEIGEFFAENNLVTYMGKSQQDIHPGMLIYRNIRGSQKPDGTYYGVNDPEDPQGNRVDDNDRVKISNRSSNIYGFTLNFGGEWKSLSFRAQLGASWGSYTFFPAGALQPRDASSRSGYEIMEYVNMPSFWAGNMFVYEDVYDGQNNLVVPQNREAKYPSMRFGDNFTESTFWKVNNANVFLRNFTVAYALPKALVNKVGVASCRLNLTGQNLLEFYNPYPDKFMSPNSPYGSYPLMRKFTLGLNISF
ncbi:MAG: TonB-dependent receptor [Tannerella sp.]|jgi:TonB-linked SusC/RagA family outer membrane protein|nr:TonB-dependent receptor [Tannerella sp.]